MREHIYGVSVAAADLATYMVDVSFANGRNAQVGVYLCPQMQPCTADTRARLHHNLRIKNSHFIVCVCVCVCVGGISVL